MKRLNLRNATILAGLVLGLGLGLGLATGASATLLNPPMTFPLLSFDSGGTTTYNAAADAFLVSANPIAIRLGPPQSPQFITPAPDGGEFFRIAIEVDSSGNLVGGNPGDDLSVFGQVDLNGDSVIDAAGSLLTGEVTGFGFQNNGATDLYDFTFHVTGGLLQSFFTPDVGVAMQSEASTFNGSFQDSFDGRAKGTLGSLVPEPASLVLFGAGVLGLGAYGRKRD